CGERKCGIEPVCQTSCGVCEAPNKCNEQGQCECIPECGERKCGVDPVCGTKSCGICGFYEKCNDQFLCECVPDCTGRQCGLDPICGTETCGYCEAHEKCNLVGICECVPQCGDRKCGIEPVCQTSCGNCTPPNECNEQGQCECSPDCRGRDCGVDPVCGQSCGTCPENSICNLDGQCFAPSIVCSDDWCLIPAGTFEMGAPQGEPEYRFDEGPVHSVTISRSFYIKQTEVTQGEWQSLMGNNPSNFQSCGNKCPVEMVYWYDAVAYANALSETQSLESCYTLSNCTGAPGTVGYKCTVEFNGLGCTGYRLPTEAEWEYAARAGVTGPRYGDIDAIAWHSGNSLNKTRVVATRTANAWGLNDVLGNVWEWVNDWYGPNYYSSCSSGCSDPIGIDGGSMRGYRGGSWMSSWRQLRLMMAQIRLAQTLSQCVSKTVVIVSVVQIRCVKSLVGRVMPHIPAMLMANVSASKSAVIASVVLTQFAKSPVAPAKLVIVVT
ncbi:MAG TPA: SUMF1/EgtB/PvdO family nonheme iron enzyme, partial [Myxococcota bacterium]|nr:SUMF1/EgtB/PvdO family nonheme iron enzyme [Myxococcota bacterium]